MENIQDKKWDEEHMLSPIFKRIDELCKLDKTIIIAIDGNCGSGKTTFANEINKYYDCNIFHMDDFYLPFHRKTKERMATPAGTVEYERVYEEIICTLLEDKEVIYRPFLCASRSLGEPIHMKYKKINIIEGSYSMHTMLQDAYDLKIFLKHDDNTQKERIMLRNGYEKLQEFLDLWIPLENFYFKNLNIEKCSDIIIDTTNLW